MKKPPETRKSVAGWLVMDKTPENIEQNTHWRCEMTRIEIDDQPTIPPLQGAGICWSWFGVEFLCVAGGEK